jgi:mRNA turnover protein 4
VRWIVLIFVSFDRFFFGKNKVIQLALGKSSQDEQKPHLHEIAERISGLCGIFMTNDPKETVMQFFNTFSEKDYARGGLVATEDITLPEGALTQFAHSMETYLRSNLGMPTELKQGIIYLRQPFKVAVKGQPLTPEQARLLKLLDVKMAEFKFRPLAVWHDGQSHDLAPDYVPGQQQGVDGDAMDDSDDE